MATPSAIAPANVGGPPVTNKIVWRARDAWVCTVLLIVLSYGYNQMLWTIYRGSPTAAAWLALPFADTVLNVFRAAWWILIVFLFTRPRSLLLFMRSAGLSRPPTLLGWLVTWLGVGIGWFELYGITKGWSPQDQASAESYRDGGAVWWSYAFCTVLLAAFYEETVMRGFLYRAFRGTYALLPSVGCVLAVVAYFHWGLLSQPFSVVCLMAGAVMLCLIRERSVSLWDCILFHAAFNATVTLRWYFCVFGMVTVLPFCARSVRGSFWAPIRSSSEHEV